MNINGFEIEQYNIHNIPDNVKYHTCPLCSHTRKKKTQKCLTLYWENGLGKCSHCGEVVQLHTFKKKTNETYKLPEWNNNTNLSENVVKWFEKRGISQFILRLMKISEGIEMMPPNKNETAWKEKNTVQFPYFRNGEVTNIKYRGGDKTFKLAKDAEKIPYNLDNIQGQEIIYMVEGEPDVLAVMECGIHNVTSPPNGFTLKGNVNLDWLNNDVEHFINAKKLVLAFDQDEPGQNGTKEFIRRFGAHKCFLVDLSDCKDSNDYLLRYGGERLKEALLNHFEVPLEGVSTYNNHKEGVRDFFLNGMPKGYVTGVMPTLDKIFSVNSGQPIMITGIPSSGKSEVLDQICLGYATKYNFKIAYASPENKPNVLHLQKLVRKTLGYAPSDKHQFNMAFEDIERFLNDNVFMIDMEMGYDLESVLLKFEELVIRKGVKVVVIDPFNKVRYKGEIMNVTGNRVNDYTNTYLTKLEEFARKCDVIPFLVAHPNKLEKGANGKRVIPDFYDVKGGGEFYDMMPHGLVVHRNYELDTTLIRTLKVKFSHLGSNNADAWFKFNINNGRYTEIIGDVESAIRTNDESIISYSWDNSNWIKKEPVLKNIEYNQNFENETEIPWGTGENDVPF